MGHGNSRNSGSVEGGHRSSGGGGGSGGGLARVGDSGVGAGSGSGGDGDGDAGLNTVDILKGNRSWRRPFGSPAVGDDRDTRPSTNRDVFAAAGPPESYSNWGATTTERQSAEASRTSYTGKWAENQGEITKSVDSMLEAGLVTKPVKDLKVVYQNHNPNETATTPDFVVKKDGTVVTGNNPNRKPTDALVVEVERARGETGAPPPEQQKALDGLVTHIATNLMEKKTDGKLNGTIHDDQGLVTEKTKNSIAPNVVPSDIPSSARQQTEAINRWNGNGGGRGGSDGGSFSPQRQQEYFPERSVPRQAEESDKLAAMKDVVAGFATRNEKDPYHHVESRGEGRGFAVGRYGTTARGIGSFCDWLSGLTEEQIEELIKKGVLPKNIKGFMAKMKSKEGQDFLKQMQDGKNPPSKDQIDQFFDKETQEAAGSYLTTKYANATQNEDGSHNIGQIALGMMLDRVPTEQDLANPEYKNLMNAAEKAYPLSLQRVLDGTANIDLSDKAKALAALAKADVGERLWTEHAGVTQYGRLGCAAAVSKLLRKAEAVPDGFNQNAVWMLDESLQKQGWKPVPFENRQPGDVIIAYRTDNPRGSAGGGAHTGIVGENGATYSNSSSSGQWSYNDPSYWHPGNNGFRRTYVLRPPGN